MEKYNSEITGHLDIFVADNEDETEKWQNILIHGDRNGLKSLAALLTKIADLNQVDLPDLPVGARHHIHLRPGIDISKSSVEVIVGRIDAKGTGAFYASYLSKD